MQSYLINPTTAREGFDYGCQYTFNAIYINLN